MQLNPQQWSSSLRKRVGWIIFGSSVVLTILNWSNVTHLLDRLDDVPVVLLMLAITEILFVAGLALMALAAGRGLFSGGSRNPIKVIRNWKATLDEMGSKASSSRLGWFGFYANFAGALGTGLVVLVGGALLLPATAWPFVVWVALLDLVATFGRCLPLRQAMRSADRRVHIRLARLDDLDAYLELQGISWGEMAANRDQLESRFRHCQGWIFVAVRRGKVVAAVTTICIKGYDLNHPPSWDEITDKGFCTNHDEHGRVMYGVDASALHGESKTIDQILEMACIPLVIRKGLECGVLGGRLPGYHEYAERMSAADYLEAKRPDGKPLDPQVRMYGNVWGLKILGVIENYFDDPESLNWGVLLHWPNPVRKLPRPLWRPAAQVVLGAVVLDPVLMRGRRWLRRRNWRLWRRFSRQPRPT